MTLKILVVDDSPFMRQVISDILSADRDLEVVATARNGRDALAKAEEFKPDVITLDVEMPLMNGLEVLRSLMVKAPVPVIMLSSFTGKGSRITMEALSLGAVEFIPKPQLHTDIKNIRDELLQKVKAAAQSANLSSFRQPEGKKAFQLQSIPHADHELVAIGASTGGPGAVEKILKKLPADFPVPIILTQHMPRGFTGAMAERLDKICRIRVKEASQGDKLEKGTAFIAPGDYHMLITRGKKVSLHQGPPVEHVRPSINVMLKSAIDAYGGKITGVILTGMGRDGAEAMAILKKCGGRTVVQDESTSVIFSMPKAVIERGAADIVAPLQDIAAILLKSVYYTSGSGRDCIEH